MHGVPGWRRGISAVVVALLLAAPALYAADSYGPVARSDTLWSIAKKVAADQQSGTTAQVAWALFQANPAAFDGAPGKIKAGATLKYPDPSLVKATPPKQAFALLTGAPAGTAAVPKAAAKAKAAPTGPVISQLALQPRGEGEPYQWLVVSGSGFAPGAVLEFRDAASGAAQPGGKAQSVREGRIDFAGRFPDQSGRWQAVVRNADGGRSAPYEFMVGAAAAAVPVAAVAAPIPGGKFDGSAEQQALLEKARAGASAEERYQLLAPLEARYAGDVDFDYPLGTLALDTGRLSEAVFVLQRAVATRPGFSGARMELARAYYAIGDNESARREFTALQKEDPPPEARRAIAQYLEAIDQRAVGYESQKGVYAELASGYDSNANGAPDIQNFIGFNLDSRNQATASGYYGLNLGGALSHPFAPGWRAVGNGLAAYRANPDASFVDSQVVRLGGGLEWRPDRWTIALLPSGTYSMLDGQENNQTLAADGSAAYALGNSQFTLTLRYAQQRYADALTVQDIDTLLYGFSTETRTRWLPRVLFNGGFTLGTDEAIETGSPFGRDLTGVRVGALVDLSRGSALLLSVSSLGSEFDGRFFGEPRSDDQLSASLGLESGLWRDTGWKLRLQASYVDNRSTVTLYDYNRIDAGLSLRKEFK